MELWPDDERAKLPYFAEHSTKDGFTQALLVFLHEGGVLFGIIGLERRKGELEFTSDALGAQSSLSP